MTTHFAGARTLVRLLCGFEPLYDKARTLGQQNNDPNAAIYKANYERVHAKLKETTKKQ
jgi:hypothetical protein